MEEADIEAARPSEGVPGSGETGETAAAAAELTGYAPSGAMAVHIRL